MVSYYDYVLGFIPLALLGVTGSLLAVGVGLSSAVPIGASASALLIGHALFVNGPTAAPDPVEAPASTTHAPENPGAPASGPVVNAD